jgi:hypothetical protein
MEVLVTVLRLL